MVRASVASAASEVTVARPGQVIRSCSRVSATTVASRHAPNATATSTSPAGCRLTAPAAMIRPTAPTKQRRSAPAEAAVARREQPADGHPGE